MKIKELKEILSKLDENLDIHLEYDYFCGGGPLDIEQIIVIKENDIYEGGLYFCCEDEDTLKWHFGEFSKDNPKIDDRWKIEGNFVKNIIEKPVGSMIYSVTKGADMFPIFPKLKKELE